MTMPFLWLFCLVACAHLYACVRRFERVRHATKPLLMPLLAAWYAAMAGASARLPVVLALLLGTVGDTLLLSARPAFFSTGTACFALGHGCYIFHMLSSLPVWPDARTVLPCVAAYLLLVAVAAFRFWPHLPRRAAPFCVLYMAILAGMSCCALLYARSGMAFGWLVFAGSLLFLVSDAILTRTAFCSNAGEHRLSVMLTYIAAQGLMTSGFLGGAIWKIN